MTVCQVAAIVIHLGAVRHVTLSPVLGTAMVMVSAFKVICQFARYLLPGTFLFHLPVLFLIYFLLLL